MQHGIVEQYSRKRRFGFLRVKDQRKLVFFHLDDGTEMVREKGKAVFGPPRPRTKGDPGSLPPPEKGDRLVFEPVTGKKGVKAKPWAYADSYDRISGRGLWA